MKIRVDGLITKLEKYRGKKVFVCIKDEDGDTALARIEAVGEIQIGEPDKDGCPVLYLET